MVHIVDFLILNYTINFLIEQTCYRAYNKNDETVMLSCMSEEECPAPVSGMLFSLIQWGL